MTSFTQHERTNAFMTTEYLNPHLTEAWSDSCGSEDFGGYNAHKKGRQWRRLESKCSHYLKWARFVGGWDRTGVDSFMFPRNVAQTLASLAQCERNTNVPEVQGDAEVPHQMAWRLWGQQASMCNAAQPVWMSANISHQLPSTWDIRWYLTYAAVLIQVAVCFLKWNMTCW